MKHSRRFRRAGFALHPVAWTFSAMVLAGCTQFSSDAGMSGLNEIAQDRLQARSQWARTPEEQASVRKEVDALLARPLTAEDAIQIALLNNRRLQAQFVDLRIAEADLVQAGRLPNPRFSTTRTRSADSFKYETSLTFPILGVVTMPAALKLERRRLEAVRLQVADRLLQLAGQTRQAYLEAVEAEAAQRYFEGVHEAAEATAELARRMEKAGNFSRLDRLREQAFQLDVATELSRAKAGRAVARERLVRLLGLDDGGRLVLPSQLPGLPGQAAALSELEPFALDHRIDIQAARREAEGTAASLGLVKVTRFVNALELGPATVLEQGDATKKGYEISVELPLFDWGGSRVARAEAVYMQAVHRVSQVAVDARSEVRENHARYVAAWETAKRYRDEVVPLRQSISDEQLLRYNGMLVSVFELMSDARDQMAAAQGYARALSDFWQAESALRESLGGRLPTPTLSARASAPVTTAPAGHGPSGD
ncbi:MAG: TolC family protein [Betaproteobacteria bacterium]|nr:TolC family protein [Betaproteobacteria bacterium]